MKQGGVIGQEPWLLLALVVAVRVSLGVQFQSIGSLGPVLVEGLQIDFAALGVLIGAINLPGIIVALPAGWLNARFGDRCMALWGLGLMAGGAFVIAAASNFEWALAGRVVSGVGAAILNVVLLKMVLDWFDGPSRPIAVGFLMAAWPLGQSLGLFGLPAIGAVLGWRIAVCCSGLLCAVGFVLLALCLGGPQARGDVPLLHRLLPGELAPLLAGAVVWTSFNAALNIVLSYGPAYFVARGSPAATAGAMVSLVGLPLIPLIPLAGWLSTFIERQLLAVGLCLTATLLIMLLLPVSPAPASTLLALGLVMGPPVAVMAAMPGQALSAASRAIGLGLSSLVLNVGNTLLPPLAGWSRDASGQAAAPLYIGAVCIATALIGLSAYSVMRSALDRQLETVR